VRYEHYDDFGSSTNPKLALRWDALPWLAFRASYTTSFRPPSFRELQDDGLASVRFFVDNKRCPLTDAQEDCFIFPYRSSTTGNPQLDPEEGDSRYFGLILTPIENLRLGIDYWVFKHEDRIVSIDGQLLINDFPVNTPFVERNPPTTSEAAQGIPGRIQIVNSTYVNADQVDTNGIDVNVEYRIEFGAGSIDLTFLYTYLNEWRITEKLAQEFTEDRAGSRELPRHRGNLGVTWNRGRHRLGGIVRYVDSYDSPVNVVVNQRETAEKFQVDDWLILDLNYQIAFERLASAALQIGCHNCTDEDVPVYNYSVAGSNLHDGRGATVYIRWTQSI
jgi:outer membrane receptor protein involved in Fe transport